MKTLLLNSGLARVSCISITLSLLVIVVQANSLHLTPPSSPATVITVDVCSNNNWFDVPVEITQSVEQCLGFDIELTFDAQVAIPTGTVLFNNSLIDARFISYMVTVGNNTMNISVFLNGKGALQTFNGKGTIVTVEFQKQNHFDSPFIVSSSVLESYETYTVKKNLLPIQCIENSCGSEDENENKTPVMYGVNNEFISELKVTAFPNPVIHTLQIQSNQTVHVIIKDATNQVKGVYSNISPNSVSSINMSQYKSGIYFITVYNKAQSKKLCVVKN